MDNRRNRCLNYILAVSMTVAATVLDQFTKYLAVKNLKGAEPHVIVKGVFQLEYLENRGAAFGLFQNQRFFFFLSVAVVCAAIVWFLLGYVVDFLYFKLIDFPIFNVADIYVTVSTALFIVLLCFYYKEEDIDRILHGGK